MNRLTMKDIIHKGADECPRVGVGGAFYPRQWVGSYDEWMERSASIVASCAREQAEVFPADVGGSHIIRKDGFVYLYRIDLHGDYDSQIYTHEVIANGGGRLAKELEKSLERCPLRQRLYSVKHAMYSAMFGDKEQA